MTHQTLTAFAIPRDRLSRWCLLGESEGLGKPVVANAIRSGYDARRMAACWNACREMTTEQIEGVARRMADEAKRAAVVKSANAFIDER